MRKQAWLTREYVRVLLLEEEGAISSKKRLSTLCGLFPGAVPRSRTMQIDCKDTNYSWSEAIFYLLSENIMMKV